MLFLNLSGLIMDLDLKLIWYNNFVLVKHILSPVGDHRGSGLVERSIHTIKRNLGTEKFDPKFGSFKETIQQIVEHIRKSNLSVL